LKIISFDELCKILEKLSAVESKDTDSSLLTNDTLNKSYECGCGSSHIFNKDTFIVWRRILGSAFVLADRNCNFANFVEQKGFFKIKMNTIYSAKYDGELELYQKNKK
jgi:hypothetical protein